MTEIQVAVAPHKLVDTDVRSEGRCMDCGGRIGIEVRTYRNLSTKEEHDVRVRTGCSCTPENDPYTRYVKPLMQWSNPGSPNGKWLYPVWIDGKGWELQ